MFKKLFFLIITELVLLMLFTGCWDRRPIVDLDVVKGMFFDKESGGEDLQGLFYRPTFQLNKEIYADVLYAKGKTFYEIRDKIQHHEGNRLVYGHVETTIFGNELAEQGINRIITQLDNETMYNRKSSIYILKSDFYELKKFTPPEQLRTGIYLKDVISQGNRTNFIPQLSLSRVTSILLNKGTELSLPVTSIDNERGKLIIDGLGIFKDDKMIGMINANKTKIYLLIVEAIQEQPYNFTDVKIDDSTLEEVAFTVVKNSIKTEINIVNDVPHIDLLVKPKVNIEHFLFGKGEVESYDIFNEKQIKTLRKCISGILKREIVNLIQELQEEYESDIIGFGEKVRISNSEYFNKHDWSEVFPLAKISVKVDVKFIKIGHNVDQLK